MTPEGVPQELRDMLDAAAGKEHSLTGPVMISLAAILTRYEEILTRRWAFGLTADEWLHLACEGEASEIAPCCGNLGAIRDLLMELAIFQAPGDEGWRRAIAGQLLPMLEADGDGHDLGDAEKFPLLHRVLAGLRAERAE